MGFKHWAEGKRMIKWSLVLLMLVAASGCDTLQQLKQQEQARKAESQQPIDIANLPSRIVRATGYAPISLQPGKTKNQQVLNAMRASKLQAYKELAAIVHGQYLYGTTKVDDMILQNEQFNAAVGGVIRGATVVKTFPIQEDTYATILELDLRDVQQAYVSSQ